MKCKNCGTELDTNDKFCNICGTKVGEETSEQTVVFTSLKETKNNNGSTLQKFLQGVGLFTIVIIVVVILLEVGTNWYKDLEEKRLMKYDDHQVNGLKYDIPKTMEITSVSKYSTFLSKEYDLVDGYGCYMYLKATDSYGEGAKTDLNYYKNRAENEIEEITINNNKWYYLKVEDDGNTSFYYAADSKDKKIVYRYDVSLYYRNDEAEGNSKEVCLKAMDTIKNSLEITR